MQFSIINSYASKIHEALIIEQLNKTDEIIKTEEIVEKPVVESEVPLKESNSKLISKDKPSGKSHDKITDKSHGSIFNIFNRGSTVHKGDEMKGSFLNDLWKTIGPTQKKEEGGSNGSSRQSIIISPRGEKNKTPRGEKKPELREEKNLDRFSLESLQEEPPKNLYSIDKIVGITASFVLENFKDFIVKSPEDIENKLRAIVKRDLADRFNDLKDLKIDLCKLFGQHKALPENVEKNFHLTFLFYKIIRNEFKQRYAIVDLASNLTSILKIPTAKKHFLAYLKDRLSHGSLLFLDDVVAFKKNKNLTLENRKKELLRIYELYVLESGSLAVNIINDRRQEVALVVSNINTTPEANLLKIFDMSYAAIKAELKQETQKDMQLFMDSKHFKNMCEELKLEFN